ncbi:MAG: Spy/CpxP family protein refolding chaperone [Sulfuricaulis sp.]|uniref:Spy/CpxP family protein refolding chaperone n=1 Tax=Sulfuricaulis sp. TaxID=2003553 RepID=UPI0034A12680
MHKSMIPRLASLVFAAALTASAATIWAAGTDNVTCGYGPGPGMMGGGHGGMGPGMGMMGGMMGMGQGMMGGHGGMGMMGPGMMGLGPLGSLDLSDEQRTKINKISDTQQQQHWAIMGKMMEGQNKLRDLYAADKPDPKKVGAVYGEIGKLQQQMIESHVQATNQMQDILTKEQRDQLRQWHRGGRGTGEGPRGPAGGQRGTMGPGNMPGNMMGR